MIHQFTRMLVIALAATFATACTLSSNDLTPEPLETVDPIEASSPEVFIGSPDEGDEITLGDSVLVSATATDAIGVTSVQLFADDRLVKTVASESATGDRNLPVVLDYEPRNSGEVLLKVIAYRQSVPSEPATVRINVLEEEEQVTSPIDNPTGPVINPNDPTCRILTNVGLNYRTGPSTDFERLGTFAAGTQSPIVGRLGDNSWWQVQVNNFTRAWVSSDFTTEYGNCLNIPVVAAPATPTSDAPTATPIPTNTPLPTNTPTNTPLPTGTPRPADLVVTSINGERALTLDGGDVTSRYSVTVTNTGDTASGPFDMSVQVLPGGSLQDFGSVSNLSAGESISLSVDLTFDGAGEFTVQVTADSSGNVDEISNINNVSTVVVDVSS